MASWFAFIGTRDQWNQTLIGVSVYNDDGELTYEYFDSFDKAIRRGDIHENFKIFFKDNSLKAPSNRAEMDKRLESMGNAMSAIKWTGPMGIVNDLANDPAKLEQHFLEHFDW